jgi:hypothetical protein
MLSDMKNSSVMRPFAPGTRGHGAALVGVIAAITMGLAGCASTTSEQSLEVTHVHAVDLDDQRGVVYVATHDGILAVDLDGSGQGGTDDASSSGGSVRPLGQWRGDVMGMTRIDDTIYFSGHPAMGVDAPANIGVYVSDVGGAEYDVLSLEGEVDFHSMAAGGVTPSSYALAGIDSATAGVRVSRDRGQTWTVGAVIAARSLSWDTTGERLYATTEQGLQVSVDDGASFALVDGAPPLLLIASAPAGSTDQLLVGIDIAGAVHTSVDGATWIPTGAVPAGTEALSVGQSGSFVVAGLDGVHRSDDRGATWTLIVEF